MAAQDKPLTFAERQNLQSSTKAMTDENQRHLKAARNTETLKQVLRMPTEKKKWY